MPTHISLSGIPLLEKDSIALLEQIRTIDKRRLDRYIGSLDGNTMKRIDAALTLSVGVKSETEG